MLIGQRIRKLRQSKNLTQGDIEQRTGLLRSYTSRMEAGRSVPSIGTLEKYAKALDVPLHTFFYDGEEPPKPLPIEGLEPLPRRGSKEWRELRDFAKVLAPLDDRQLWILLRVAQRMATRNRGRSRTPKHAPKLT